MTKTKNLGGIIWRLEPNNLQWVDQFPRYAEMMRNAGWFPLCERMQGHNMQVTKDLLKFANI